MTSQSKPLAGVNPSLPKTIGSKANVSFELILVPSPLDFGCEEQSPITNVLPLKTIQTAAQITHWIVENAKTTRAVLKRIGEVCPLRLPIQEHVISELPREVHKKGDHGGQFNAQPLLETICQKMLQNKELLAQYPPEKIGLMSEAGMPAVADPGSSVVRASHALGMKVTPLVGASSLLLALAASGLNGQNFAFVGYLPIDATTRIQRIKELETIALKTGQTQLFIEVPHRNAALFDLLLRTLKPSSLMSIASGLTLQSASLDTRSIKAWNSAKTPPNQWPWIFSIGV